MGWLRCDGMGGGSEEGGLRVGLMDEGVGCGEGFEGLRKGYCEVRNVGVRQRDASEMWRECVNCAVCGWVIFRAI